MIVRRQYRVGYQVTGLACVYNGRILNDTENVGRRDVGPLPNPRGSK
ncbi:MAG TPA: hypothetical protein VK582_02215 [Pyrinomonadaceae bacterium]|nr:hypothetical protein [Pyrinomonadaceae bacterium]